MTSKTKPHPSPNPVNIDEETWYYESRRKITLIHWTGEPLTANRRALKIQLPWRKLMDSARRCRPEDVKRKAKP